MNKALSNLVWPILAAPLALLAMEWNRFPDQVAIHFNLEGSADDLPSFLFYNLHYSCSDSLHIILQAL